MKSNQAILSLKAAVEVSPDNLPLRHHLAMTLADAGQLVEAQAELQEALRILPDDAATLLELARISQRRDRPEEAAARLRQALQADDALAPAHLEMARVLWLLGSREKAAFHYEQAMKLDPTLSDSQLESDLYPPAAEPVPLTGEGEVPVEAMGAALIAGLGIPLEQPQISFKDAGGMESLKEQIRLNIIYPFQRPDLYEAYGKKVGGGAAARLTSLVRQRVNVRRALSRWALKMC